MTRFFGPICAVDNLSLRVEQGRLFGFLGPNDAGKSTTLKMLTGMLAPSRWRIRLFGMDMSDPERAHPLRRRIGLVPEYLALFDDLTAREYLLFIGRMYDLPLPVGDPTHRRAPGAHETGRRRLQADPGLLHGRKKKLALAVALLPGPDLLFLDGPFEGVDPVSSRRLKEILQQCVARGATVFLTSHVLKIVERLCTAVAILHQGRLVFHGTMKEIRRTGSLETLC